MGMQQAPQQQSSPLKGGLAQNQGQQTSGLKGGMQQSPQVQPMNGMQQSPLLQAMQGMGQGQQGYMGPGSMGSSQSNPTNPALGQGSVSPISFGPGVHTGGSNYNSPGLRAPGP